MLNLKPSHKPILEYYKALEVYKKHGISHENAVKVAFQDLLTYCCKRLKLEFVAEFAYQRLDRHNARIDGVFLDQFSVPLGYWEAKDSFDNLEIEIKKKFADGYPKDNIIFQTPERAIIYQGSRIVIDADITNAQSLVDVLNILFSYKTDTQMDWEKAVEEFRLRIPESAKLILDLIDSERKDNTRFINAFNSFLDLCKTSINPNISLAAVEEMLVQHMLTERIFRKVFENPDFVNRNIIAQEIDRVIEALTSRKFNRNDFLKPLDRFYSVLEKRASEIDDYSVKQTFLNTVYEKFFQGFAIKIADTHGIVYTPQPIVNFMVESVELILQKEFNRSISSPNVHILDPFTGTGNFIVRIMRQIDKTELKYKYENELHCNELMLMPYYVASMNIEHEYYEQSGEYIPFQGICLVDTFQLAEGLQNELFNEENTLRVENLKQTPIFVYIGNPPYNAGQVNENDNNKNRKYPVLDQRVAETFTKDSKATLKNSLSDPYIKAFRMAIDKVIENGEGIISYVTNNSYLEGVALDGMRKHLYENFDKIYIFDLNGNVRKNPKISGTTHNVFGIQVGVALIFLIKHKDTINTSERIYYTGVDDFYRREDKYRILNESKHIYNIDWKILKPNDKNDWLNEGLAEDWEELVNLTNDEFCIFQDRSNGVNSGRDVWVYQSNKKVLVENLQKTIKEYNRQLFEFIYTTDSVNDIDYFVEYDEQKISWSATLKNKILQKKRLFFEDSKIITSLYRPFYKRYLYYDGDMLDRKGRFWYYFPTPESQKENMVICVPSIGSRGKYWCFVTNLIPSLTLTSLDANQCFPFYTYNEDGTGRTENISDWALDLFREKYGNKKISKWDIFYYIYAVLHKPSYREKYALNLRRELPRIPFYDNFSKLSGAGKKLADLHLNYENIEPYRLEKIETQGEKLDWKVKKMKLSKDKSTLYYNDFLTLSGIPIRCFDYKLGNRSALEWVIDQYQLKIDKRSGIVNDPNNPDEPDYIYQLIGRVIAVSLATLEWIEKID